ncbi:MAG: hypothetical protein KBS66_03600 [Eubacterium sp.]|nr:hypothetical protein [Candidatus Colimonas fimequi]
MVSYIKFLRFVKEQLHEYLPDDYSHMKIEVIRANKRLGKTYDGIQVYEDDSSVGVSYDLHHYYSAMDDLSELPSVLQMIAFDVVQALDERPPSMMDMLDNPDYFLHHLIIDVVNLAANAEELKTMPHKVFDDMAIIYRLLYVDSRGEMYSTPVTDDIIREFDFDDDEMFEQAARNTSNIFPI